MAIAADGNPIALNDVLGIPDILDASRFLMLFGQVPGGGSDTRHLSIKAFNVTMPGVNSEAFEAVMGGRSVNFRGRRVYNNPVSLSFYEDSRMQTLTTLRTWMEYVVGTQSGNSVGYVDDYSVDASLIIFDTTGARVAQHTIYRVYPVDIGEVSLSSESSTSLQITAQFRFTYFLADTHPEL